MSPKINDGAVSQKAASALQPASFPFHTDFPVYCLSFLPCASNEPLQQPCQRIVVGGGGGPNRSGIPNRMCVYRIEPCGRGLAVSEEGRHELNREEEGCLSLAIHPQDKAVAAGINRSEEDIAAGNNLNCRVFAITDSFGLHYERAVKTVQSLSGDEYMRSCCFSLPDGKILAVGSSEGEIVLLRWPSLSPFTSLGGGGGIVDPFSTSNGQVSSSPGTVNLKDEIVDVSFSSSTTAASTSTNPSSSFSLLACCARSKCLILGLQHQQGKTHSLITLDPPPHLTGSKDKKCEFRASRFITVPTSQGGTISTKTLLYTALNTKAKDASFIVIYEIRLTDKQLASKVSSSSSQYQQSNSSLPLLNYSQDIKIIMSKCVSKKPISSFTISSCGMYVGFACADLSVSVMDTRTLTLLKRFPNAHSFPVTTLSFSANSTLIASGSADGTLSVFLVPATASSTTGRGGGGCLSFFLRTLLLIILVTALGVSLLVMLDIHDDAK